MAGEIGEESRQEPCASAKGGAVGALLTDLYQLTMAFAYWKAGKADQEAVFHLFFRKNPFQGGFTIGCGLQEVIEYLRNFRFTEADLDFLASIPGGNGKPIFEAEFLEYLGGLKMCLDVDAIPEGTVVFPHEPLVRVRGPILQAQIVETALLNLINFPSLIATKAARVCIAAEGDAVVEFGLRRAQGPDGALTASRAAYIGGCTGTSNVLAAQRLGIPVSGTHAHSWVMSFDEELMAFEVYAEAMPNNCIFLVDTYDSLEGVRNAVQVGEHLRKRGFKLAGIRLDSGDLAYLSIEARKILDAAGFRDTSIVASNDLNERLISSLKQQGAAINVWGVGTRLVTAYDQPALGGVYKLSAIRREDGNWEPKVKISEQTVKVTTPGILQVRRFRSATEFLGDAIYDERTGLANAVTVVDPIDPLRQKPLDGGGASEDLLVPICRNGTIVYEGPALSEIRERTKAQLAMLHPGIKRFDNPHRYPAGLEIGLHELRTDLATKRSGRARLVGTSIDSQKSE